MLLRSNRYPVCVLLWSLLVAAPALAAGTKVIIAPTRIVFEGGQRSATVQLHNRGTTPSFMRVSVVNKRMLESGLIVDVDEPQPDERFLGAMLRYSPRRVVIPPGQSQTVRLLLRGPPGGALTGEYRSHLTFRSMPTPAAPAQDPNENDDAIRVRAIASIEISIPVIYRVGRLPASVRFSPTDVRLEKPAGALPTLRLRLEREGERSVHGDVVVDYVRPDGSVHQVAQMGGIAVYYPPPARNLHIRLQPPDGLQLDSGELRVSFRESDRRDPVEGEITIPLR